jgi:hypothetical protein
LINRLLAYKSINIDDSTSIVPITVKWPEVTPPPLLVFVQREKKGFRIIKVIGTAFFEE